MQALRADSHHAQPVVLDLCFDCHGIWFDHRESLQLSPRGVLQLFETLHAHREQPHSPLKAHKACPQCRRTLLRGVDRTISGSYVVYRCPQQHGRFGTFSSFMIEKGFVRQMTQPEIRALADRVRAIHCNSCGATVDLRKDHACPYCRSAFSLLDPEAVEKALGRYRRGAHLQSVQAGTDAAGALELGGMSATERAEARAAQVIAQAEVEALSERRRRERQIERLSERSLGGPPFIDELWSAGLDVVWRLLRSLLR